MAMVNIPSQHDDPQYRYKMPRLMSKKEGKGNGSKTCIVNMGDVARAIKRPPQYTTKWFGNELGAQSKYTNKEGEGERAIVNGHHDTAVFQTMLDKFIEKYVLCPGCRLPEIDLKIKKEMIMAKCNACGWRGDLDNNHRLATFIVKNPPDESGLNLKLADEGGGKCDKKKRGADKVKVSQGEKANEGEEGTENGSLKEKKDKKEKKEKKEEKSKREVGGNSDDGSEAKEQSSLSFDDDDIKELIASFREESPGKVEVDAFYEEIRNQQLARLFDNKVRLYVVLEVLFPETMRAEGVEANKKVLEKFIEEGNMQAPDVLWCFDAYLENHQADSKRFPLVLQAIYNEDWAQKPQLLSYYEENQGVGEPGFEIARKTGAPFLKWLAEEDSDEDEDDDDDEDGN